MKTWLKLYIGWWESEWLIVLSSEARLCWLLFLERVKSHGDGGRLKRSAEGFLARQWYVGEESIRQMLKAAENDGAVIVHEHEWEVANWRAYQGDPTGAERQARFRERHKTEPGDGHNALRNARNTEERRGEEKRTPSLKGSPKGAPVAFAGAECPEALSAAASRWEAYRRECRFPGWKRPTWESNFRKYGARPFEFAAAVDHSIGKGWRGLFEPDAKPEARSECDGLPNARDLARVAP